MKLCPGCASRSDDATTHCAKCGRTLAKEPVLMAFHEYGNPGGEVMRRIHQRHRRFNLRTTILASILVQVLLMGTIGFVHDWTLLIQALVATGIVLLVHQLRCGALLTIAGAMTSTFVSLAITGHLGISSILAIWLLAFWYVFLGHQIAMNNEMHG